MIERAHTPVGVDPAAVALIERYEAVAAVSRAMRAAVCAGDWERLAALGTECAACVTAARTAASVTTLPAALRPRRMALLSAILEDDAVIRRHTEPSFERCSAWLAPTARSH